MPAKKPAPKAAVKGKKAAARPAARKAAPRKVAVDRTKSMVHARKPTAPVKKPAAASHRAPAGATEAAATRRVEETLLKPASLKPASSPFPSSAGVSTSLKPAAAPAPDADDGDGVESLLAGPRNVQPYIVKRGELYMSKDQLEHFRHILTSWKRDLMVEVDRTVSHMKDEAANFPDPNDRATQEEEFSLELRTRDRERKLIRKIDDALKRIEDGSYGYCLETGEEIGIKRLEARPVATLSLEAQERRERREKQYGDRDDRYR
jgi:DnaK suppressor protein